MDTLLRPWERTDGRGAQERAPLPQDVVVARVTDASAEQIRGYAALDEAQRRAVIRLELTGSPSRLAPEDREQAVAGVRALASRRGRQRQKVWITAELPEGTLTQPTFRVDQLQGARRDRPSMDEGLPASFRTLPAGQVRVLAEYTGLAATATRENGARFVETTTLRIVQAREITPRRGEDRRPYWHVRLADLDADASGQSTAPPPAPPGPTAGNPGTTRPGATGSTHGPGQGQDRGQDPSAGSTQGRKRRRGTEESHDGRQRHGEAAHPSLSVRVAPQGWEPGGLQWRQVTGSDGRPVGEGVYPQSDWAVRSFWDQVPQVREVRLWRRTPAGRLQTARTTAPRTDPSHVYFFGSHAEPQALAYGRGAAVRALTARAGTQELWALPCNPGGNAVAAAELTRMLHEAHAAGLRTRDFTAGSALTPPAGQGQAPVLHLLLDASGGLSFWRLTHPDGRVELHPRPGEQLTWQDAHESEYPDRRYWNAPAQKQPAPPRPLVPLYPALYGTAEYAAQAERYEAALGKVSDAYPAWHAPAAARGLWNYLIQHYGDRDRTARVFLGDGARSAAPAQELEDLLDRSPQRKEAFTELFVRAVGFSDQPKPFTLSRLWRDRPHLNTFRIPTGTPRAVPYSAAERAELTRRGLRPRKGRAEATRRYFQVLRFLEASWVDRSVLLNIWLLDNLARPDGHSAWEIAREGQELGILDEFTTDTRVVDGASFYGWLETAVDPRSHAGALSDAPLGDLRLPHRVVYRAGLGKEVLDAPRLARITPLYRYDAALTAALDIEPERRAAYRRWLRQHFEQGPVPMLRANLNDSHVQALYLGSTDGALLDSRLLEGEGVPPGLVERTLRKVERVFQGQGRYPRTLLGDARFAALAGRGAGLPELRARTRELFADRAWLDTLRTHTAMWREALWRLPTLPHGRPGYWLVPVEELPAQGGVLELPAEGTVLRDVALRQAAAAGRRTVVVSLVNSTGVDISPFAADPASGQLVNSAPTRAKLTEAPVLGVIDGVEYLWAAAREVEKPLPEKAWQREIVFRPLSDAQGRPRHLAGFDTVDWYVLSDAMGRISSATAYTVVDWSRTPVGSTPTTWAGLASQVVSYGAHGTGWATEGNSPFGLQTFDNRRWGLFLGRQLTGPRIVAQSCYTAADGGGLVKPSAATQVADAMRRGVDAPTVRVRGGGRTNALQLVREPGQAAPEWKHHEPRTVREVARQLRDAARSAAGRRRCRRSCTGCPAGWRRPSGTRRRWSRCGRATPRCWRWRSADWAPCGTRGRPRTSCTGGSRGPCHCRRAPTRSGSIRRCGGWPTPPRGPTCTR
ncbi:hypothetical protein ACWV95_20185 [Streptomyces albus]